MITYDDLQDVRDKDTYKQYIEAGFKNQRIAMNRYANDQRRHGGTVYLDWIDANEKFQETIEGIAGYKPDVKVTIYDGNGFKFVHHYEVKVSTHKPGEFLFFKRYQIGRLADFPHTTSIFFSTDEKYFTLDTKWIEEHCDTSFPEQFGGKECYRVWVPGLIDKWIPYSDPIDLVPYPKRTT